jgi:hypothetical protein
MNNSFFIIIFFPFEFIFKIIINFKYKNIYIYFFFLSHKISGIAGFIVF